MNFNRFLMWCDRTSRPFHAMFLVSGCRLDGVLNQRAYVEGIVLDSPFGLGKTAPSCHDSPTSLSDNHSATSLNLRRVASSSHHSRYGTVLLILCTGRTAREIV